MGPLISDALNGRSSAGYGFFKIEIPKLEMRGKKEDVVKRKGGVGSRASLATQSEGFLK